MYTPRHMLTIGITTAVAALAICVPSVAHAESSTTDSSSRSSDARYRKK